MSDGFTLDESIYAPGLRMPMHAHERASFGIVFRGGFTERIGRKFVRTCAPLSVVLRPPGEAHAVTFHSRARARIFRVEITDVFLERICEEARGALLSPAYFDSGMMVWLALRLFKEFEYADEFSTSIIESLVVEIIASSSRIKNSGARRGVPRWLEQAREMLHAQITAPPPLATLAAEVGVHPVTLAREFRRRYDVTTGEYVRCHRVELACQELAKTSEPLADVAARFGFYDGSHFSHAFKRTTGLTPAEYRALRRARS